MGGFDLIAAVLDLLRRREALRLKCYADRIGIAVGYGRNITLAGFWPLEVAAFRDKYGDDWRHRIKEAGIDREDAEFMLRNDVRHCADQLASFAWFSRLDDVRRGALVLMAFQLGVGGLRGFHDMIAALIAGASWSEVAKHGADSPWAKVETPARAAEVLKIIETGQWPSLS